MAELLLLYPKRPTMKAPLSVLIIDDDPDMCHLLKQILSHKKIHAATAHNLEEGLHCLKETRPAVVFLDNNLPDGSGVNFIKKIKSFDPSIKVIMITGDTVNGLKEVALKNGAHSFLPKPFSYELIDKAVESVRGLSLAAIISFPLLAAFSFFSESA